MIELISKYRSAPERKRVILGVKAFAGLTSCKKHNPAVKNALTELKTVGSGVISCYKELNLLLCDVLMVAAAVSACIIIKCSFFSSKKKEKEE